MILAHYEQEDNKTTLRDSKRRLEVLAYKKVANQVKPVATMLPKEFWIVQKIPEDPLVTLPSSDIANEATRVYPGRKI